MILNKKGKKMIIYEPRGRAKEYSPLAANLYTGCLHGCKYCYAPACLRRDRNVFHSTVSPRKDVLANLEKDLLKANKKGGIKESVLLCFTSDPYQNISGSEDVTRDTLILFRQYNVQFQILTKGGTRASRDFDLYSSGDKFACTLTFDNDKDSLEWEPNAALPQDRILALMAAKKHGITTWVSFEPVLDEFQVYSLLEKTKDFVDLYKIGKCSGDFSKVKDWRRFATTMIEKCESYGKKYYIKQDLKRFLDV
jgi:DNA repair photolyase